MPERQASAIQFDDFVSASRPDPARAEPLALLAGYVGAGIEPGSVRIHPDANLNQWYEVAQDDIVHSAPIEGSPLGGSNVWVKASAPIAYGIAAPAPPQPAGGEARPEAVGAPAPDTGLFNPVGAAASLDTMCAMVGAQPFPSLQPICTQPGWPTVPPNCPPIPPIAPDACPPHLTQPALCGPQTALCGLPTTQPCFAPTHIPCIPTLTCNIPTQICVMPTQTCLPTQVCPPPRLPTQVCPPPG